VFDSLRWGLEGGSVKYFDGYFVAVAFYLQEPRSGCRTSQFRQWSGRCKGCPPLPVKSNSSSRRLLADSVICFFISIRTLHVRQHLINFSPWILHPYYIILVNPCPRTTLHATASPCCCNVLRRSAARSPPPLSSPPLPHVAIMTLLTLARLAPHPHIGVDAGPPFRGRHTQHRHYHPPSSPPPSRHTRALHLSHRFPTIASFLARLPWKGYGVVACAGKLSLWHGKVSVAHCMIDDVGMHGRPMWQCGCGTTTGRSAIRYGMQG
jgi:hypothetical protein